MKACYKAAKQTGDREEEARWANQIGHAYKNKADYVSALTWFRLDYDISCKRQASDGEPSLNMMPTCQSLGEVYLRLANYPEALHYQVTKAESLLSQLHKSCNPNISVQYHVVAVPVLSMFSFNLLAIPNQVFFSRLQ